MDALRRVIGLETLRRTRTRVNTKQLIETRETRVRQLIIFAVVRVRAGDLCNVYVCVLEHSVTRLRGCMRARVQ